VYVVGLRTSVALAAVLAAAFMSAGCGAVGNVTSGDPSQGKKLFTERCGSCHTLADAKTQGTTGPNLDDAFASDKEQGFDEQTMADVVRGQIAYPEKPMPPNLVEGTDANDVSVYVAKCSANPNCGVTAARAAPPPSGGGQTTTTAGGGGAQANGKAIFTSAGCAGCHTLKDANATGNVGPNLDQVKPSKDVVAHQVEVGGGAMPAFKGRLSDAQIQAVSAYVAQVAGK
jgi:mono/diheme cytochrome c family protein